MNMFKKELTMEFAKAFPIAVLNKRADRLLANKPSGFHPIQKRVYRRECREMLESYQYMIERHLDGRILGNKNVSSGTKLRMEKLKERAR